MPHIKKPVSKTKARTILREGEIGGKKLTPKQKGFFGALAGGVLGHPKRRTKKRTKR